MKQSRKDLIFKLYNEVSSELGKELKKEFPQLFKVKPLEVGKWYNAGDRYLVCIDSVNGYKASIHGFKDGNWFEVEAFQAINGYSKLTQSTDKEVETALIKEAKKRGFKKSSKVKCLEDGKICTVKEMKFSLESNALWVKQYEKGCWCKLFNNGKWATIIETITKEQAEKELGKTILN